MYKSGKKPVEVVDIYQTVIYMGRAYVFPAWNNEKELIKK